MPLSGLLESPETFEWITKSKNIIDNSVNIIGFPFDGTASFKKGTKLGPNCIRKVAEALESYSPFFDIDITEIKCFDLGDLNIGKDQLPGDFLKATIELQKIIESTHSMKNVKFLIMGGEHSISFAPIISTLKKYPDLLVIHLDAHADLREEYEGNIHSHASILKRTIDHFKDTNDLIQFGIRSGTKEEFEIIKKGNFLIKKLETFLDTLNNIPNSRPIYLTLDLDFFDPSVMPGTGTPEPGGHNYSTFETILGILNEKNLMGADVVELSPPLDLTEISSVMAAKIIRELTLCLA